MTFGLTADGFKMKRLDDILAEKRQKFKDRLGKNFDTTDSTIGGQLITIPAEREAKIWELAQATYNSQYRATAEGVQLDNAIALTGNTRDGASYSKVTSGVARGPENTIVLKDTIISVQGNPTAKFKVLLDTPINIVDGDTFKSAYIQLQAVETGPFSANAGTLTVIETPIPGLDSFTNELDAEIGKDIEKDPDTKARVDNELQIAGSATVEAILSELNAKEYIETAIVFQNIYSIPDLEGRPPKSLDIVVLGGDDEQVAKDIFLVIGGGIETIGEILENVIDSQGFVQPIKFSRPTGIPIWVEVDLVTDPNLFPDDGAEQVEQLILDYGLTQKVGQRVVVFGTNDLAGCFRTVPGITDFEIRVGKVNPPVTDDNINIAAREIAQFDTSRILVNVA